MKRLLLRLRCFVFNNHEFISTHIEARLLNGPHNYCVRCGAFWWDVFGR